jgi:hypothetical protein
VGNGAERARSRAEFDRGTERPVEYAAKLAAYYRYLESGRYKRDYESFPAVLVVSISEVAEARFAMQAYTSQQRHATAHLSMFLTTTSRIEASTRDVLGSIWRSPTPPWIAAPVRACWLPRVRGGSERNMGRLRESTTGISFRHA